MSTNVDIKKQNFDIKNNNFGKMLTSMTKLWRQIVVIRIYLSTGPISTMFLVLDDSEVPLDETLSMESLHLVGPPSSSLSQSLQKLI